MRAIALILFVAISASSWAELIPASRLYTGWTNSGVIGGLPDTSGRTIYTTINSTGDSTDRASTINTALANCPSNQVVVLGSGTFRVNSVLYINNKSGVTLRGSGMDSTIIDSRVSGAYGFVIGNTSVDWPYSSDGATLSANESQGQTVLSMSSTASYTVGDRVKVFLQNSQTAAWPVIGTGDATDFDAGHVTKIVAKDASTITIQDPLPFDFTTALGARVHIIGSGFSTKCGIESLTLDYANTSMTCGLHLWNADECFVYNVKVKQADNQSLWMVHALHCTIQKSFMDRAGGGSPNGAGILMERSGQNLIHDNIIYQSFPLLEMNFQCTGNVFAYNFLEDTVAGIAIDPNHGAHNAYNLFEGNVAANVHPDGYFGSVSHDTVFRNRLTAVDRSAVQLKRMTRSYNIVGNILGTSGMSGYQASGSDVGDGYIYQLGYPNIGNNGYSGTAEPSAGDWWADWPGGTEMPSGFQELDLDVANTLIRKGNYNTYNSAIPASESLGSDTLPNSYYLGSKPSWFKSLAWPPFDPTNPQTNISSNNVAIPAGYRYVNGTEPPDSGDTTSPTVTITSPTSSSTYSTSSASLSIGGSASDNVGVSSVTASMSGATTGSITITGTTSWSGSTTLNEGDTTITVTAADAASNTGTDTITVTYTAAAASGGKSLRGGTVRNGRF